MPEKMNAPLRLTEFHRLSEAEFLRFRRFLFETSGIDLGSTKLPLVESRLAKRVNELGLQGFGAYWRMICAPENEAERQFVVNALSTNETYFFREAEHFTWLAEYARQTKPTPGNPLRIWSAAGSTGEEAYSCAIVLADVLGENGDFEVLATDINTEVIKEARRGIYARNRATKVPPHLMQRYFLWGRDEYRGMLKIAPEIAAHVHFRTLNLTNCADNRIGRFDVILLRNVMIYFNPMTKCQVLRDVCSKLSDDGMLLISHSESLSGIDHDLVAVRPSFYRKRTP